MKQQNFFRLGRAMGAGLTVLGVLLVLQTGSGLAQMDQTNQMNPTTGNQAWAQEMRQSVQQYGGMDAAQREQMLTNLDRCLALGMDADLVADMFPQGDPASHEQARDMLQQQDRILGVGEAGLPMEPMMEKMREGRMKHVQSGVMDRVLDQTDHNLRVSDRVMRETVAGGVAPSGRHGEMTDAVVDLSRCMWDGLHEEDLDHLGQQAQMRAQAGGCGLDEFVAANQAAARFTQSGMDRARAVDMASEALHNGYSAGDMYTMGEMMMAGGHSGGDHQAMMESMDGWIHAGMSMDEMTEHMMDGGWMGPADMMGPGGSHPMNDMGMGGAGHDGGMGDGDHDHGGMGGDGGGMGGDGGGMGGGN